MTSLESNVKPRHGKPSLAASGCSVLPLSAEFCGRLGGCLVVACNNGVHRYLRLSMKATICFRNIKLHDKIFI